MNHSDTLHNPVIGVHVEVITSTIESSGQLLHIRSTMRAKQMDPVAYHFHKGFSEEFTVVSGRLDLIFWSG